MERTAGEDIPTAMLTGGKPGTEIHTHCPSCHEIFTWRNCPLTLDCGHPICNGCLANFFEMAMESPGGPYIEVICYLCAMDASKHLQCPGNWGDFEKFRAYNCTENYTLLRHIYAHSAEEALAGEKSSMHAEVRAPASSVVCAPDQIIVSWAEDDTYMPDTEEKPESKTEEKDDCPNYAKFKDKAHERYSCDKCKRIFNRRNLPFKMKCGHTVCERCVVMTARFASDSIIVFNCPCKPTCATTLTISAKIPQSYPLNWVIRKSIPIRSELLKEIYDKISIEAKTAAYEFTIRFAPHNAEVETRICCQQCKSLFYKRTPYLLVCGHSTCLDCAFKSLRETKGVVCHLDGKTTRVGDYHALSKDMKLLGTVLKENKDIPGYVKENYVNLEDEYPPEVEEGRNECFFCCMLFNETDRTPYYMCANKHLICKTSLVALLNRQRGNTKGQNLFKCAICPLVTDLSLARPQTVAGWLGLFQRKAAGETKGHEKPIAQPKSHRRKIKA